MQREIVLFVALWLACVSNLCAKPVKSSSAAAKLPTISPMVYVYPPGETDFGAAYSGTGFVVTPAGDTITAAHVVPGDACTLQMETTTGSLAVGARVHYRDVDRDVVLVKPEQPLRYKARPVQFSAVAFREGEHYMLPLLYALDRRWPEFKAARYTAECVAARDGAIYLDAKLPGGASGGPVMDANGRVGALVVSTRALPMQLGHAAVDQLTTAAATTLPQSQQFFFVVKAQLLTTLDVRKMVSEEVGNSPSQ